MLPVCTGSPNAFVNAKIVYSITGSDKAASVRANFYSKVDNIASNVMSRGLEDSWERQSFAKVSIPQDKLEAFMLQAVGKK